MLRSSLFNFPPTREVEQERVRSGWRQDDFARQCCADTDGLTYVRNASEYMLNLNAQLLVALPIPALEDFCCCCRFTNSVSIFFVPFLIGM